MTDLRCQAKLHGLLLPEKNLLEVKCHSRFCGAKPGVVVLHYFDLTTGILVDTYRYQDPGGLNGSDRRTPPLRAQGGEGLADDI